MAEGEKVGGKIGHYIDLADHPLVFAVAMCFVIFPIAALLNWGFTELGWPGPASLFKNP
ncbi:MAG: hypothetical protein ACRETA_04460 [Gammaproteobacteria bacterium]